MKSRASFFNWGLSRNILSRSWPLWAVYLAALVLVLPLSLVQQRNGPHYALKLTSAVLRQGEMLVVLGFIAAAVTAMVMFSFLYQHRSCGMICALPLRRETVFWTAALTGLVPLLLAQVLTVLLTALLYGQDLPFSALLLWLAMASMTTVSFYGFACFCACLTGSLLVLPAVYTVLSFTAVVAEGAGRIVLSNFVFGLSEHGALRLSFLSPPVQMIQSLRVRWDAVNDLPLGLDGLGILAIYCALGLMFLGLALLLYRRRKMETAGDVVAIPLLKPVFKYCLSLGSAIVFAWFIYTLLFSNGSGLHLGGLRAALLALGLLLLGGFIGYYAAEMLIQKTLRVFPGRWKGFLAVCGVLCLFVGLWELDAFGYERRIPRPEDVAQVSLDDLSLEQPENIRELTEIHRQILSHKAELDSLGGGRSIRYVLKNGRVITRSYALLADQDQINDPESDWGRLQKLLNCQEALERRTELRVELRPENVQYFDVSWTSMENGRQVEHNRYFSPEEALDYLENAMKADVAAGSLGRRYLADSEEYLRTATNVRVILNLYDASLREKGLAAWDDLYLTVFMDSQESIRWLREHIPELEICTAEELQLDKPVPADSYA